MNSQTPAPDLDAIFQNGLAHFETGQLEAALEHFDRLTKLDPDAPAGHYFKGLVLGNMERHEEALVAFRVAFGFAPSAPPILLNLGLACLQTQRWEAAMLALCRYLSLDTSGDDARAHLLLGLAAAKEASLGLPITFEQFLERERQTQRGDQYSIDLQDPLTAALLTLSFATLGDAAGAGRSLDTLRAQDISLAAQTELALPRLAQWAEQFGRFSESVGDDAPQDGATHNGDKTDETNGEGGAGATYDWEADNDAIREHLARFAHLRERGEAPSLEAYEELFQAFNDAYFLVPTEGEAGPPPEDQSGPLSFSIMLCPHDAFDGNLVSIAFTGVEAARAFFDPGKTLHRVVMPGSALAGFVVDMARALEPKSESKSDEERSDEGAGGRQLAALIVNPAGPHPFIFALRDLLLLSGGGTPLDASHALITAGSELAIRPYDASAPTRPSPALLAALREAVAQVAPELGVREVFFFELTIGNTQPHLGLSVTPDDKATMDALGNTLLEVWHRVAPPHAIYDLMPMSGDLDTRIRHNSERLWPV